MRLSVRTVLIQLYILIGLFIIGIVYAANPDGFLFSAEVSLQLLCQLFLVLTIWFFGSWYLIAKRLGSPANMGKLG